MYLSDMETGVAHRGCGLRTVLYFEDNKKNQTPEEVAYRLVGSSDEVTLAGDLLLTDLDFAAALADLLSRRGFEVAFFGSGIYPEGCEGELRSFLSRLKEVILSIPFSTVEETLQAGGNLERSLAFLGYAAYIGLPIRIQRTLLAGINDRVEDILFLRRLEKDRPTVSVELFPSEGYPEDNLDALQSLL